MRDLHGIPEAFRAEIEPPSSRRQAEVEVDQTIAE
jgi:hypothetical protein